MILIDTFIIPTLDDTSGTYNVFLSSGVIFSETTASRMGTRLNSTPYKAPGSLLYSNCHEGTYVNCYAQDKDTYAYIIEDPSQSAECKASYIVKNEGDVYSKDSNKGSDNGYINVSVKSSSEPIELYLTKKSDVSIRIGETFSVKNDVNVRWNNLPPDTYSVYARNSNQLVLLLWGRIYEIDRVDKIDVFLGYTYSAVYNHMAVSFKSSFKKVQNIYVKVNVEYNLEEKQIDLILATQPNGDCRYDISGLLKQVFVQAIEDTQYSGFYKNPSYVLRYKLFFNTLESQVYETDYRYAVYGKMGFFEENLPSFDKYIYYFYSNKKPEDSLNLVKNWDTDNNMTLYIGIKQFINFIPDMGVTYYFEKTFYDSSKNVIGSYNGQLVGGLARIGFCFEDDQEAQVATYASLKFSYDERIMHYSFYKLKKVCKNNLSLMWINSLAGNDYLVLDCDYVEKLVVSDGEKINKVCQTKYSYNNVFAQDIEKEAHISITASKVFVSKEDMKGISELLSATRVYVYYINAWYPCIISNKDFTYINKDDNLNDFTITALMHNVTRQLN